MNNGPAPLTFKADDKSAFLLFTIQAIIGAYFKLNKKRSMIGLT